MFINYEASRTGGPIALLRFMEWARGLLTSPASCLLIHGGAIEQDFATICPTTSLVSIAWRDGGYGRRLLAKMGLSALGGWFCAQSALRGQVAQPTLIFCNTIFALEAIRKFPQLKSRIVCYVHELEFAFRVCMSLGIITKKELDRVDRFIACSQAVAENLVAHHDISRDRIDVVHEFIPQIVSDPDSTERNRRWLRGKLKVPPATLLVGGSGTFGWRKGTDLFVQVARMVKEMRQGGDVHFLWLGGSLHSQDGLEFTRDIELSGLEDFITVIPSQPNPLEYFSGLDLFLLTSREDPFPLVCLEAAAFGVPLVCFARSGGMPEFVGEDSGIVVDYLDVAAVAARVVELLRDKERRLRYGRAAQEKVRVRHDVAVAGPKILAAMQRTLTEPARAGAKTP